MYQILNHALQEKGNTTKFTLFFSNVSAADILLKTELDALAQKYPDTLKVVYVLDKAPKGWTGPTGFISKDILAQFGVDPKKEKTKVFVCGPPGQVKAISGQKAGMKQGELGGILKEMGFTEDQVFKF